MRSFSGYLLGIGFVVALCLGEAHAQDKPGKTTPEVQAPVLKTFVEAVYPSEAQAAGQAANVELFLTIDAQGKVTDAQVATPAGSGFDEAALEAAKKFEFEPAKRDGKPIAVRIRYRYVFELKKAPAEPEKPTLGRIEGWIRENKKNGKPLINVVVVLVNPKTKLKLSVKSDDQGRFAFDALEPASYELTLSRTGYETQRSKEIVEAGVSTDVRYALSEEADDEGFVAVARVAAPAREVTKRTLVNEELSRIAGTRGDALRAIEILPGVGRPPFSIGLVLIRGSGNNDSQVFFEGAPIPLLYHFGGLTGVIPTKAIDGLDYVPGNFSTRYGRKSGGVIEIRGKDPGQDGKLHAMADVNVIDSSAYIETPVGDKGGILLSARRSYIDLFVDKLVSNSSTSFAAPVYYDYQAIGVWRPNARDKFRLSFYGSSDTLRLFLKNPSDSDPTIRGNLDIVTSFHNIQGQWRRKISDAVGQRIDLAFGFQKLRFAAGDSQKFVGGFNPITARAEWDVRAHKKVKLITGLDLQITPARIDYIGPAPRQQEGDPGSSIGGGNSPNSTDSVVAKQLNTVPIRPAAYAEVDYSPTDAWHIIPGIRSDYYSEIDAWSFDPRFVARYAVSERTVLKGGAGIFSQPPEFQESINDLGNPNLKPFHAVHTSLGVEQIVHEGVSLGAEVFYKRLYDRVVAVAGLLDPRFTNQGVGNIYGTELSAKVAPGNSRFFGQLSYTLLRSERKDADGQWRLFDFDQTHILVVAGAYNLGRGWDLGATFRFVSGNPYTPINSSSYDARNDVYQPIYGAVNSQRNPAFHRVDVRIEKKWRFSDWRLAMYLDVQNAYNRMNQEGVNYNYDYSQTSRISGLPIIPVIGVRGEIP